MAAPSKPGSRWGSYLQQAVGGLESRLDNLLAEGQDGEATKIKSGAATPVASPGPKLEAGMQDSMLLCSLAC